ncbi:MAG: hypothetical protein DRJ05_10130 [Bacteroidetes bacterium]|nr:MAG: hypothetical protein DRJ05_10130 [Bacteroidota bacterium]
MKNLISLLSILLIVLIGFTAIAQKPEWINLKEKRSNRNNQYFNEWKSKSHKDAIQTKGLISKPGNSEDYYWNETYWDYSSNTEYSYNTKGFPTEELSAYANSGENSYKRTWAYDSHDNQTESINYYWNDTEWEIIGGFKTFYTYNENGNITEELYQFWEPNNWVSNFKFIYEYNNSGFEIGKIVQLWENDTWVYTWKDEYTVGSQGEWLEITYYDYEDNAWFFEERIIDIVWQNWDQRQIKSFKGQIWEGEWINDERYNATFTGDNYIGISEVYENNTWKYYERLTYTKTPTERIELYEGFENKGWVNSSKYSIFYDEYGSHAGSRDESWEIEEWVTNWESSNSYTYNEYNDITEKVSMDWNWDTHELDNLSRYVYSNFQHFESGENDIISIDNAKVFPNPVGDILNIDILDKNLTEAVVQIIDITGQKVYEGILSNQLTSIDIKSLSTGVYILHIQTTDNRILNYKILKD